MQPNNQQGYYQPDQNQPVPPQAPAVGQPLTGVDPAALQAALSEPGPVPVVPVAPLPPPVPSAQVPAPAAVEAPPADEEYEDDEDEGFDEAPVTWTAHEYLHQEKGTTWYVIFGVLLVVSVGLTVWLQQWTFTAVLVVIAVVIVINAKRPPRELTYALSDDGLTVDSKLHKFSNFKSFGIIRDGEAFSVMLIPIQRFQPSISVYFPEESGEAIVDMLGSRLPMKDLKMDAVDHVVRFLRL